MSTQDHFITMIRDQCLELVGAAVAEQLKPLYEALRQGNNAGKHKPNYFTTEQTLAYLHLTKPTLNKLRRQNLINSIQCSDNRVLYECDQLDAYLQSKMEKGKRDA